MNFSSITRLPLEPGGGYSIRFQVGTGRASPEEATTPKRIPTARQ
jgi:hypothetical protein